MSNIDELGVERFLFRLPFDINLFERNWLLLLEAPVFLLSWIYLRFKLDLWRIGVLSTKLSHIELRFPIGNIWAKR